MKPDRIFIGDIKKCTDYRMDPMLICEDPFGVTTLGCQTYESKVYEKDVVLIKFGESAYIPFRDVDSFLSYFEALMDYRAKKLNSNLFIHSGSPYRVGQLFVDAEELMPFYDEETEEKNISIRALKQDIRNRR